MNVQQNLQCNFLTTFGLPLFNERVHLSVEPPIPLDDNAGTLPLSLGGVKSSLIIKVAQNWTIGLKHNFADMSSIKSSLTYRRQNHSIATVFKVVCVLVEN